ncbi:MAG TPA: uroporphyrinogen-III synthase [Acetobacteraceae bacterium]|nr:uroporphyrinogen-III synthase [Acetobacteraceae bacterium]
MYVLITRPLPTGATTAGAVAALGFVPLLAPALVIRPREVGALPTDLAAIAVTSGNALLGLPALLHRVPLFAVGDATATRARAAGFADVTSAGADAAALAGLLARRAPPGPLLLAVGEGQGAALEQTLRAQGREVHRRVLYAAEPAAELPVEAVAALRSGTVAAALFFSAETSRAFVRLAVAAGLADAVGAVRACAIGAPAVVALRTLRWREIRQASRPTQDAMLALLQ